MRLCQTKKCDRNGREKEEGMEFDLTESMSSRLVLNQLWERKKKKKLNWFSTESSVLDSIVMSLVTLPSLVGLSWAGRPKLFFSFCFCFFFLLCIITDYFIMMPMNDAVPVSYIEKKTVIYFNPWHFELLNIFTYYIVKYCRIIWKIRYYVGEEILFIFKNHF
jgi:hypothetical protein